MKTPVTRVGGGRFTVHDWLDGVVPDWLAEVMRPKKVPTPWATMVRAVLAIWVPLAIGLLTGHLIIGLLPAIGGLMSIMIDTGGPLRARVRRVGTAAVFGGALGLVIGSLIHGRGWVAVAAVVGVAGVSSVLARLGGIGSVTGLQLFVYSALGLGPFGELHPWWHTALEFGAGVAWALLLLVPGWLASPRAAEQRLIATAYHRIADGLRAIGTEGLPPARRNVTTALNEAYDALLADRRSATGGRSQRTMRLVAILNVSQQMAEAAVALLHEGERPPPSVTDTIDRLADAITDRPSRLFPAGYGRLVPRRSSVTVLPVIPPPWSTSPGALALRESMVTLCRVISGNWTPPDTPAGDRRTSIVTRIRIRAEWVVDQLAGGWIEWTFTARLMICTGVAAVLSEVAPIARSYWVVLTVAIIMKPDLGSVFARALQRGIGTVVGAVLGAVILAVVPYGPWLLLPFGLLAALLPYGQARNFGLSSTFLTPLVVLLIDLLQESGWRLAGERAIDTILGTAIVLIIGYALWPVSWQAHLPDHFAASLRTVSSYMTEALVTEWEDGTRGVRGVVPPGDNRPSRTEQPPTRPAPRSGLRRQAFRSLSNVRAEFQRTLSEPEWVSRRASAWWPAIVGLEEVVDAVTTTAFAISRGAPRPAPKSVHQIAGTLRAVADAVEAGITPTVRPPLPSDPELQPVTDAVRSVLLVLTPRGREPTAAADATIRSGSASPGGRPPGTPRPEDPGLPEADVESLAPRRRSGLWSGWPDSNRRPRAANIRIRGLMAIIDAGQRFACGSADRV
jgi:fusaric acid resistance family protein